MTDSEFVDFAVDFQKALTRKDKKVTEVTLEQIRKAARGEARAPRLDKLAKFIEDNISDADVRIREVRSMSSYMGARGTRVSTRNGKRTGKMLEVNPKGNFGRPLFKYDSTDPVRTNRDICEFILAAMVQPGDKVYTYFTYGEVEVLENNGLEKILLKISDIETRETSAQGINRVV